MPTTSPRALNSGPPELPGFTATSVWMKGTQLSSGSERPLALTMPAVAVFSKPYGEPIASTHSPTSRSLRVAERHDRQVLGVDLEHRDVGLRIEPSTLALNSRRSVSLTVTSLASRTTCALVRMMPSALMMKPEPCAAHRQLRGCRACGRWPLEALEEFEEGVVGARSGGAALAGGAVIGFVRDRLHATHRDIHDSSAVALSNLGEVGALLALVTGATGAGAPVTAAGVAALA